MKINYKYQDKAAKQVLKNALNNRYLASVLAACPGSGKTTISHKIINQYVAMYKHARIVVLTEGQNTLKNQYLDELESAHVPIEFTYGDFSSDAQVRVGLPQSISQLDWSKIDLLIVDEAHNFYFAEMVQAIIKRLSPKHQILMTGSPTKYNALNAHRTQYGMYYIAAEELQRHGVFAPVSMDVVRTLDRKNAVGSIKTVMQHAIDNGDDMSKIMVACPTIKYANQVAAYLRQIGRKVSLSTSKNDPSDAAIKAFKADETNTLIVVGKGILGFNDKKITLLADLRSSDNIDASYQLFARVLRTHPAGTAKAYYRIADSDFNKQVLTLHKIFGLMKREIFIGFNGKNLKLEVA